MASSSAGLRSIRLSYWCARFLLRRTRPFTVDITEEEFCDFFPEAPTLGQTAQQPHDVIRRGSTEA